MEHGHSYVIGLFVLFSGLGLMLHTSSFYFFAVELNFGFDGLLCSVMYQSNEQDISRAIY